MIRQTIIVLLFISFFSACRKEGSSLNYSKIVGNFVGIGTVTKSSGLTPPDAFLQYNVTYADAKLAIVNGDTLHYATSDLSNNTITYIRERDTYNLYYYNLIYDYLNNTTKYTNGLYINGWLSVSVSNAAYKHNPSIGTYVSEMEGIKTISGTMYDTFLFRKPNPYMIYNLVKDMTLSKVNDSTLSCNIDSIHWADDFLHYKYTDYAANTVTFENFHEYFYAATKLTYNYVTKKILLEQRTIDAGIGRSLRME